MYGGTVTIGYAGELDIEGGSIPDVTLDGVNVDSNNSIEVGVSSDVTFTLDDGTKFEGGSLTINSGSTLDVEFGSNSFSGAAGAALDNVSVSGFGTILVDSEGNGADLALGGDTLVTGALLSIAALGAIEIGADVSGDDYVSPTLTNLTADNAGTIQIEPNATLLIGGTVTLNGGGTVELMTATEEFAGAIAGAGTGTLDNHNNTIIADGFGTGIGIGDQSLTFINELGGTVDADGNDSANNNNDVSIAINTGNAVTNQGLLEATNGGTLFIDDALNNSGTVLTDSGTVAFSLGASGSLANIGSGAVQIAGGGIVEFLGPTDDQPDVTFAGPGTLEAASYHGTIIGFGTGDAIDLLDDVTYTAGQTVDWTQMTTGTDAGGTLELYNSSHILEATLDLTGTYSQDDFAPVPDSSSADAGTEIEFSLPNYTFITDFTKNNNIQADLIKEFPTGQFTANDSLATPFDIASDSNGNNYYDGFTNGSALTIDVSISDVTNVYTLMNAYSPGSGFEIATVEFIATGGITETFELVNGDNIRDFFQGNSANTLNNTPISDPSAENAFSITTTGTDGGRTGNTSTGSSGTYNIDEQDFALSSAFASQTLTEIVITDLGGARGGSDVPTLLGITAESGNGPPVIAVPGEQILGVDQATAISGVTLSESGNTTGETFTVTLLDGTGELSANTNGTGGGGTITGTGTTDLIVSGTLTQVNADLATLTDTETTTVSELMTLNATDSLGNSATQQAIAVNPDNWIGGTGNWTTTSDWSLSAVPTSAQTADLGASGSYTVSSSGTVTVSGLVSTPTATLDITGGAFTVADYAGQGPLILSGGTLNIGSSTAAAATLTQSGGTLNGTGMLTVTGLSTLSGGTQSGTGTTVAQGGAAFSSTGFGFGAGRTLQLDGTSTASGTEVQINLNAVNTPTAGTLMIASGATFNDQTTGSGLDIVVSNFGGGDNGSTAAVNNEGTFEKTGSATTSTINTLFNNSGTVNVEAGTLDLTNGGTDVGATYEGTGTIEFSGGTRTLDAASSITTENVVFLGGTETVNGTYNVSGTTTINGGTATACGLAHGSWQRAEH